MIVSVCIIIWGNNFRADMKNFIIYFAGRGGRGTPWIRPPMHYKYIVYPPPPPKKKKKKKKKKKLSKSSRKTHLHAGVDPGFSLGGGGGKTDCARTASRARSPIRPA